MCGHGKRTTASEPPSRRTARPRERHSSGITVMRPTVIVRICIERRSLASQRAAASETVNACGCRPPLPNGEIDLNRRLVPSPPCASGNDGRSRTLVLAEAEGQHSDALIGRSGQVSTDYRRHRPRTALTVASSHPESQIHRSKSGSAPKGARRAFPALRGTWTVDDNSPDHRYRTVTSVWSV